MNPMIFFMHLILNFINQSAYIQSYYNLAWNHENLCYQHFLSISIEPLLIGIHDIEATLHLGGPNLVI